MGTPKQFATRQGRSRSCKAPAQPLQSTLVAPARGSCVPILPRAQFPSAFPLRWFRERAERLHRFCKAVERRRAAGMSLRKAVRYFAWFWKDRPYRTAPHIKARFSKPTLVALYYRWRRNGKSPDCFELHYAGRLPPVTAEEIRRFADACARADTVSLRRAVGLAGFEASGGYRILARLPGGLIQGLKGIFKDRRQARIEAEGAIRKFKAEERRRLATEQARSRKLERQLRGKLHRLLAADVARSRKLTKLAGSFIGRRGCGGDDSTCRRVEAPIQGTGAIFKPLLQTVCNQVSTGVRHE